MPFLPWVATVGNSTVPLSVANGGTGSSTSGPLNFALPVDFGHVAWAGGDPGQAGASGTLALGTLVMCEFFVRTPGQTITNIGCQVTTGQALTAGQNFAFIFDANGNQQGITADQTAAWASASAKTMALTSAFVNVPVGRYYAGLLVNGATSPTFRFSAATPAIGNLNTSGATLRYASQGSVLTAVPASITLSSNVVTNANGVTLVLF